MSKQAPYAQWREELNLMIADTRSNDEPLLSQVCDQGTYLESLKVRLLLEQVELLDRIVIALDALVAARYGG